MNKIAQNTLYLYGRQVVTTILSLFTSRIVLQALGVVDLGVYGVVGSVVTMFAFASGAVSSATNRFLTYGLGNGDIQKLKQLFSCSLMMQIMIAMIIFLLIETVGVWFLNYKMNISAGRLLAANYVMQCLLFSTLIGIISVPFSAAFAAHEQMGFLSLIGLLGALMKLGVITIVYFSKNDRLMLYATLLLLLPAIQMLVFMIYGKRKFEEVTFRPRYIRDIVMDMCRFAGWSLAGAAGVMGRNSGVNIVVNMVCGVVVNASRGLACQVSAIVMGLAANLQSAFSPQIMKRYAAHDEDGMVRLMTLCSKYSFFLISLIIIPFFLRADDVLRLWLGQVPQYLLEFAVLIMVLEMIYWVATPIGVAIGATGDNKWYQVSMAIIMLLDVPVSYLLLRTGIEPYYAVFGSIVIALISFMVGLLLLRKKVIFSMSSLTKVMIKCIGAFVAAFALCFMIHTQIDNHLLGLVLVCGSSLFITTATFYLLACDNNERLMMRKAITAALHIKIIAK